MNATEALASVDAVIRYRAYRYGRPGVETADLEQAARVAVLRALPDYDPSRGSLVTFATFAIRKAMNVTARRDAQGGTCGGKNIPRTRTSFDQPIGGGDERNLYDVMASEHEDTGDAIDAKHRLALFRAVVATLPDRQRSMLVMQIEGSTLEQIAEAHGCVKQNVCSMIERILPLILKRITYAMRNAPQA